MYDYATSITKSKNYYNEHRDEFMENDTDNSQSNEETKENDKETDESGEIIGGVVEDAADSIGDAVEDMLEKSEKFIDYKIKQLKDVTDKAKYDITFYLSKDENDEWILDDISDSDRQNYMVYMKDKILRF